MYRTEPRRSSAVYLPRRAQGIDHGGAIAALPPPGTLGPVCRNPQPRRRNARTPCLRWHLAAGKPARC
jgi:hypothetical protein